jgi:hypothetical protein
MPLPHHDVYPALQLHLGADGAPIEKQQLVVGGHLHGVVGGHLHGAGVAGHPTLTGAHTAAADAGVVLAADAGVVLARRNRTVGQSAAMAARGRAVLAGVVKGRITRLLLQTDKVRNMIRTIHDTRGIIAQFADEGVGTLTYNDRGFLRRAQSQLSSATTALLGLFRQEAVGERVRLLRYHREQERENLFRSSVDTAEGTYHNHNHGTEHHQQGGEHARLLSDATRRQLLRKSAAAGGADGVATPGGSGGGAAAAAAAAPAVGRSPMLSRRQPAGAGGQAPAGSVHRSAPEIASPKHQTDFLRRKTGTSASGKHSNAYNTLVGGIHNPHQLQLQLQLHHQNPHPHPHPQPSPNQRGIGKPGSDAESSVHKGVIGFGGNEVHAGVVGLSVGASADSALTMLSQHLLQKQPREGPGTRIPVRAHTAAGCRPATAVTLQTAAVGRGGGSDVQTATVGRGGGSDASTGRRDTYTLADPPYLDGAAAVQGADDVFG